MTNKIYSISLWGSDNYKIEPCEVIKETDKTFTIKTEYGSKNVRKETMSSSFYIYCLTEQLANKTRLEIIQKDIDRVKAKIDDFSKQKEHLEKLLSEYKAII